MRTISRRITPLTTGIAFCLLAAMAYAPNGQAASSKGMQQVLKSSGYHQKLFGTKPLSSKIGIPLAPPRKPIPKHPGFIYAETKQWNKVAHIIAEHDTPSALSKVLTWLYLRAPGSKPPYESIRRFMAENPEWPYRARLKLRAEEALFRAPQPTEKARWFKNGHANTLDGQLWLIESDKRHDRKKMALKRIHKIWARYPFSQSQEKNFLKRYSKFLSAKDHWSRMETLIWERRIREAHRQIKRIHGQHRTLAETRLAFATRSRKAKNLYRLIRANFKSNPGLVYEYVRWLRRNGKDNEASNVLLSYKGEHPYPAKWWKEAAILGRDAINEKRYKQAYQLAIYGKKTTPQDIANSEWLAGWIALEFLHRPQTATLHFQKLFSVVKTPVSLGRGAYWTARAFEADGNAEKAAQWYQKATAYNTTYYGQLASYKIGRHSLLDTPVTPISDAAYAWAQHHEFADVLKILYRNREMWLFKVFARAFYNSAKTVDQRRAVVDYVSNISLGQGVFLGRVLRKQNIHDLSLTYPIPDWISYPNLPEKPWILGVIRQESNFDTRAKSPVGASGLMQLMPRTAKVEARIMDRPFSLYTLIEDPNTNVEIGSHYLQRLLETYDGQPALALAAYNAGPFNVNKWIKRYGDPRSRQIDTITWIESIPFKETRNYVQRIFENHYIYQWLLQDTSTEASHTTAENIKN